MPHLRFRGFDESILEQYAPSLLPALAGVFGCPEDWISLEVVVTRYITRDAVPMVEVLWFPRDRETQDRVAKTLYEAALTWVHPAPIVVFLPVAKTDYYEDGKSFG